MRALVTIEQAITLSSSVVTWKRRSTSPLMCSRGSCTCDLAQPANIFLTTNGVVKVGDLGLGRSMGEHSMEAHSKVRRSAGRHWTRTQSENPSLHIWHTQVSFTHFLGL
jgi:hypothetical protein